LLAAAPGRAPRDVNVLLITIDTLRYDHIGILSDKYVKTPHLDDLGRRSVIFANAYAHNPLTRPSHTNILTGTLPPYHGVSDNPGFKLESRYLTLAEYLKAQKYKTAAFIGAFILDHRFGLDQGFDVYDDSDITQEIGQFGFAERRADRVIRPALEWILAQSDKWFCWVHLFDPHDPYDPPEPFKSEYAQDPYSGEIAYVDAQLGLLLDALNKSGAMAKTVIILTADHGEAFGEKEEVRHGFFAYNTTLHVPLFVYDPEIEAKTVRENACHVDIFPTVCDLLKIPAPEHLQGESLLPLIEGQKRAKPQIYFESMSPCFSMDAAPLSGFIEGHLKFIDQPIKEVYDLSADPEEENNLASSADTSRLSRDLEALKKNLKGAGTKQDLSGKNPEIRPLMQSLGYVSGNPTRKKSYGVADDVKILYPLIAQLRQSIDDFKAGRFETAVKKLNLIIRIRPNYVNAYTTLADTYYNLRQLDDAIAILKTGLDKNPDKIPLMSRLGIVLLLNKRDEEAIDYLQACAGRDPSNPDHFVFLGRAYMDLGDIDQARKNLNKALALDPRLVAAHNNLGYLSLMIYIKTKDKKTLDAAIASFQKALSLNPNLDSAKKGLATALGYQKK
jgi:arylsulfatase A-like enzyme/Tfp pilus assembly protein PilF